jgi:hypothetical protein
LLDELGIEYKQIHSCKNDCILYIYEYQNKVECPVCKEKRYCTDVQGLTIPKKVLRHMPIICRLQRMFRCNSLAQLMDWHAKKRSKYGFMRISTDSKAMKHIEEKWPSKFQYEPRSIRFGLAIDGLCPFSFLSSNYSVWPVELILYNIPPWMSVRKEHLMPTFIVPEKHQVKNMDVYIVPFIDEMQLLWKGIRMYDISRPPSNRSLMLHGVQCWTIHDFLGLGVFLVR